MGTQNKVVRWAGQNLAWTGVQSVWGVGWRAFGGGCVTALTGFLSSPVTGFGLLVFFAIGALLTALTNLVVGRLSTATPHIGPARVEVVNPTPNVDVITTKEGASVDAYLALVNFDGNAVTVDMEEVSVGDAVSNLAAHKVTLPAQSITRVKVTGKTTADGEKAVRALSAADVNGWLIIPGSERVGFRASGVPVRNGGVRAPS